MSSTTYTNCGTLINQIKANVEAFHKRLRELYPCVDDVTKLPQTWSPDLKAPQLGLTHDNLGCYFRGHGRRDEDDKYAAAVRTDQPIPASCLLYYFEITFISKGRDGFMGLGLTTSSGQLNKLPGWARESFGYHADDGNKFNGDGRGNPFGPTFTTGDIIGCGWNLVEGKCFFTKNGLNLGVAFDDVPSNMRLYPTIGLKTPGEEIHANFGQEKFVYNIEQDIRSLRKNMTSTIANYPITGKYSDFGSWQTSLHQLVQQWLLQNSYPATADAFTKSTKLESRVNLQSIQQRHRIQQLVLNGKISDAIKQTDRLCPQLLQNNPNLLFALKCRQFIELISGAEHDYQPIFNYASEDNSSNNGLAPNKQKLGTNEDESENSMLTNNYSNNGSNNGFANETCNSRINNNNGCNGMIGNNNSSLQELMDIDQPIATAVGSTPATIINAGDHRQNLTTITNNSNNNVSSINGNSSHSNSSNKNEPNNRVNHQSSSEEMEFEFDKERSAKLIKFGRELSDYLQQLDKLYGKNEVNEKMLQDAIGLIAFTNPKKSCFGKLLDPAEREPLSQLLNSSIVEADMGEAYRRPLEEVMIHLRKLVKLNDSHGRWLVDSLY